MNTQEHISPYLVFNGNCAEAMNFYHGILGGKLDIMKFGDTPMEVPEEQKEKVMHCTLANDGMSFMASDAMMGNTPVMGTNIHMSLSGTNEELLTHHFNALADGGTVTMPLAKQFWGDTFGMLTDKYGIHWMVNIGTPKSE